MNHEPAISVVIPTYNRAQQTIAAIESVLAQTYPHREILVIDDGSTDGSSEVIRQFVNQRRNSNGQTHQICYFRKPNQGPSAARNKGIEKAQGEYIAFLDSDDTWLPEKLEWQVRAIEQFKGESGACCTDAEMADNSGAVVSSFAHHGRHYEQITGIEPNAVKLLARSPGGFWLSTLLARTDIIRRIGGFDAAVSFAEDSDLYFRLSQTTSLSYVNKILVHVDRTSHPNDSDCRKWENLEVRLRGRQYMLEKWLGADAAMPPDARKAALQYLREIYSLWTNWYLEAEQYDEARQAVNRAMKCEMTPALTVKWVLTWLAPALVRRITAKAPTYL